MEEAKIQPAAVTSRKLPKEFKYYFIFMGPAILLFSSLFVIPFFGEIYYSFTNWNGIDQIRRMGWWGSTITSGHFRTRDIGNQYGLPSGSPLFRYCFPT